MGLFRKSPVTSPGSPITAFWTWWAEAGHLISPHRPSRDTEHLNALVTAIHPELAWHFGPGADSEHRLTVSAGGVAVVRPWAERWLRAAPAADPTWEFRSSQQADPDALTNVLEIGGHPVGLAATVFRVEPVADERRIHVGVHHPAFAELPDQVRTQVTFLVLDWLVGEDDVERWLGHIEALVLRPEDATDGDGVLTAVARMAAEHDPDGWALAQWTDPDGHPGLASFRPGLRWIDHPTFDRHQRLRVRYPAQANGLPVDAAALEALREIEDGLEAVLGSRGILVGHESLRGQRTFHAYSDGEDQNLDAAVAAWARAASVEATAEPDPAWSQVRHLTG